MKILLIAFLMLALSSCGVGPETVGIDHLTWQSMSDQQRQRAIETYQSIQRHYQHHKAQDPDDRIRVKIRHGWAMMPPFEDYYRYKPVSFELARGECRPIQLQAKAHKDKHVKLLTCYKDKGLYLDPGLQAEVRTPGSVLIPRNALWEWGFDYDNVTTTGTARLLKTDIHIDALTQMKDLTNRAVLVDDNQS